MLLQFEVLSVVHSVQRTAGELFWGRALSGRESGLRLCLGSVPIQGSLLWHIQFCFRLKGSPAPFLYRCFWHIAPPFLWFSASPHFLFLLLYLFLSPLLEPFLFSHYTRGLKKIHSRGRNDPHSCQTSLSCLFLVKNYDGGDFQFLLVVSEGWKPWKGVAKNLPWLSLTFPNHECKLQILQLVPS